MSDEHIAVIRQLRIALATLHDIYHYTLDLEGRAAVRAASYLVKAIENAEDAVNALTGEPAT
jgi:hypothetical protein